MGKYRYEFKEYNVVRKDLNDEQLTLDNIRTGFFEGKPNREEKLLLKNPEQWAKYAFNENKEYYVTAFDGFEIIACINYSPMSISVDFLEKENTSNKLINYMTIVYSRRKPVELVGDKFKMVPYDRPEVFVKQIERFEETKEKKTTEKIFFFLEKESDTKGKMIVNSSEVIRKPTFSGSNTEKETIVNLTNNWMCPPTHYLDFDRFLDYETVMKPEYLDLKDEDARKYIYQDGSRFYKDEDGNLIEDN